jgi:hypothetical protein
VRRLVRSCAVLAFVAAAACTGGSGSGDATGSAPGAAQSTASEPASTPSETPILAAVRLHLRVGPEPIGATTAKGDIWVVASAADGLTNGALVHVHAGVPQVVDDEPLINANQLAVEADGRLWLPILGKDWLVAVGG